MSWIKIESHLPDKDEIYELAELLNTENTDEIVGKCIRFWAWFDNNSENGTAPIISKKIIDRTCQSKDFCNHLITVGWLEENEYSINLPNYERHNSNSSKKRALTSKRVAKHKAGNANSKNSVTNSVTDSVTDSVTNSVTNSVTDSVTNSVTEALPKTLDREDKIREEKRREENINKHTPPIAPRVGGQCRVDNLRVRDLRIKYRELLDPYIAAHKDSDIKTTRANFKSWLWELFEKRKKNKDLIQSKIEEMEDKIKNTEILDREITLLAVKESRLIEYELGKEKRNIEALSANRKKQSGIANYLKKLSETERQIITDEAVVTLERKGNTNPTNYEVKDTIQDIAGERIKGDENEN